MEKQRYAHIDICKGILIYLVVLGHVVPDTSEIHRYVFMFHMPAFYLIAGIFLVDTINKRELLYQNIKKKTTRLLLPYLSFSILLGTLARNGDFFKTILGTVYSSGANITSYTYVYYFVVVLFLAIVIYFSSLYLYDKFKIKINKSRFLVLSALLLYIISHLINSYLSSKLLNWMPWNLDLAFFAYLFVVMGKILSPKIVQFKVRDRWVLISLVLSVLTVILFLYFTTDYTFNFKSHEWTWGWDIIVPVLFLLPLLYLSKLLSLCGIVATILCKIGEASFIIFFTHPLLMNILKSFSMEPIIKSLVITILSYLLYVLLSRMNWSRKMFIGT